MKFFWNECHTVANIIKLCSQMGVKNDHIILTRTEYVELLATNARMGAEVIELKELVKELLSPISPLTFNSSSLKDSIVRIVNNL